jgi:hypothetical protein
MKTLFGLLLLVIALVTLGQYCESQKGPYDEGMHWDYSITCQDGFIYKTLSNRRGTIQVLNSDGTPLRCGKTRY